MKGSREVLRSLATRRSVRSFKKRKVGIGLLDKVVDAGRWAPSPHDTQPWAFVIINSRSAKMRLARALADAYSRHMRRVSDERAAEKVKKAYERTTAAPALILLCLDSSQLRPQPSRKRRLGEWIMATQSVAAAAENMLIAANALGLGACWRGAPLFCAGAVRKALNLPDRLQPQVLIEVGHPSVSPSRKALKDRNTVVAYNGW